MNGDARVLIYLVDDDEGVLRALSRTLTTHGYEVLAFSSPTEFVARHDPAIPGCAIVDVAMPDLDGLELQTRLRASGTERPIIFLTGVGDIPTSVKAMKAGAVDFLTKPVRTRDLVAAIEAAVERDAQAREQCRELDSINSRLSKLTPREREVLVYVISGRLNKQIAWHLGTVEKTIKLHRSRMMHKMGVRSVADLVRIAERAGIQAPRAQAKANA